ncbi:hypothetical protein AAEP80_09880 [Curtobacterium sp. L3-7]
MTATSPQYLPAYAICTVSAPAGLGCPPASGSGKPAKRSRECSNRIMASAASGRSDSVEHDVIADERPQPRPRMFRQRGITQVHVVHTGVDERYRLEQRRHVPMCLDSRQSFAEPVR